MMMGAGMLVLLLVPLLAVVLLVIVIAAGGNGRAQKLSNGATSGRYRTQATFFSSKLCPVCHRPMQADWRMCPHDGAELEQPTPTENHGQSDIVW